MPYSYKYVPKGPNADILTSWLKAQKQKSKSIDLLILRACKEYGLTDLEELTQNAFLNNQIPNQNQAPTEEAAPVVNEPPVQNVQPKPKPPVAKKPVEKAPQPNRESSDSGNKANLGFLSR